jgi:tetratricopeptide (TPR) repeat protein
MSDMHFWLPILTRLYAWLCVRVIYKECPSFTQVLADDQTNVKALFRRARAKAALGQSEDAINDFKKALKLAPGDKEIARELSLAVENEKAVTEKQKKMYKEMFKPQPEEHVSWSRRVWRWIMLMLKKFWPFRRRISIGGKKIL